MKRREFITALGGAAATVAWPLVGHAEQSAMPAIGYLSGATNELMRDYVVAFHRGLADVGYIEGQNVSVDYQWAEGNNDRLPALAAELVRRRVDVIAVGGSTPGALAAKAATQTIPVVFLVGTDPVKVGLVTSMNQPGGNITGITILNVQLIAKCLELMHSLIPPATTIAVLLNPANKMQTETEKETVQGAARGLGARVLMLNASNPGEIDAAFATIVGERAGALVVSGEYFFLTQRDRLVALAARHAVPTIYAYREFSDAGGLMSYGTDNFDAHRLVGANTGRILKGEKPADLPVQQITKVELIINLKTARALGISFPLAELGRADQVIE
jgi:putative tryptophan/tyrosine transport system substrate-binding protein